MRAKLIKFYKYIWTLVFLLFCGAIAIAQEPQTAPSDEVELRQFDEDKLREYREDSDYQYEPLKEVQKGAFSRFVDRVRNWFLGLLGSGVAGTIWEIFLYLLLIGAFVLFIIKILGLENQSFFKAGKKQTQSTDSYKIDEESLDTIDFEEELRKANQSGQWRLAIRLTYLYALKYLSDTEKITVKKGKTNHEYLYELSFGGEKENFSSLSFLFDYTWYGHFEASEVMVSRADTYLKSILSGRDATS